MAFDREWRARAACADMGNELFLPPVHSGRYLPKATRAKIDAALAVCGRCPVRRECLIFAVAMAEHSGVWGGRWISERELPRLRRALADDPANFPPGEPGLRPAA